MACGPQMRGTQHQSDTQIVHAITADGARVAVKHRANRGGPPVIFLHGLAVNADLWNLPEVRGTDFHYRSLASLLHAVGYDIWLVNLRGHGAPRMYSAPAPEQDDWCLDHFILYDLPAVVDHVVGETGRRPFIIGASMGAMTLAGYLEGTRLVTQPSEGSSHQGIRVALGSPEPTGECAVPDPSLPRSLDPSISDHIIADPQLAADRQARLAGAVFVEFPAALRWPDSLYDGAGRLRWRALLRDWWRNDGDVNYPFELVARWGWLHALLRAAGQVRVNVLGHDAERGPWYKRWRLPLPLSTNIERAERLVLQAALSVAGTFTGATHHRAEVMLSGHRYVLDHMKAGVLCQLAKCVRQGAFVSALGTPDHVYSDHYELLNLPILVVQGGRDRIANAEVTRTAFFERVRSKDRQWLLYPEIAHGELEAAPIATERVYPAIVNWVTARMPPA
jgi:alpha-beta hydrolase superfamily lysophospholipase